MLLATKDRVLAGLPMFRLDDEVWAYDADFDVLLLKRAILVGMDAQCIRNEQVAAIVRQGLTNGKIDDLHNFVETFRCDLARSGVWHVVIRDSLCAAPRNQHCVSGCCIFWE